ncbi:ral guanine nucleotide dissociation stimulator-like [Diceros bicornis minor]|uniref:ral guanine nucleotide dissociation stimulator-like n=1 Tax=Diceros bicornis minor TaxID=77932 RepID=UPI0026E91DA0|nr:ral guanine nucleotide dissociation stimulator-like [Diceros bicornis minor]
MQTRLNPPRAPPPSNRCHLKARHRSCAGRAQRHQPHVPQRGHPVNTGGPITARLAALLLLLLPGEQEHGCRLREQVGKNGELKRDSRRQPGAHAAGGAGRAEGRGSLTEQPAAPRRAPAAEIQPVAEAGQWTVVEVELAPAPSIPPPLALEPASPPSAVLELEQGPTSAPAGVGAAELESPGPSLLVGSPSPPVAIKEGEKKPNLTAFPPKLVAEQLTVMDASVEVDTNRTCCTKWLCRLHEECEILKNFSSLRAVVSALQKTSISHLKNTWADVSRESSEKLKEFCSHDKSLRRELMTKGVVPYLGTFLGDLLMLHLAMGDYLEGSEINLQKRTEEYRVMREILLLQVAAKNYNLEPEERFGAWFQDMELLNENDSYSLSCQLGPQA